LQPAGKGEDAVKTPANIVVREKVVDPGNNNAAIETGL
jgi:hypothetical protein